jgi:hypothetical protein
VSWEQRLLTNNGENSSSSLANAAARGGRGGFKRGGGGRGRGRGRNNGVNNGGRYRQKNTSDEEMVCQLCGLEGHTVIRCFKRFDATFQGTTKEKRQASSASVGYGVDTNWYTDTCARDHITGDLERLTVRYKYHDNDQVHTASGAGMRISQIGQSFVQNVSHARGSS